MKAYSEVKKKP